MKLLLSFLFTLFYVQQSGAQISAKVFAGIDDYRKGTFSDESVYLEPHSDSLLLYVDYIDYDIYTDVIRSVPPLKKRSWGIECNGMLYINCKVIKYKWFVPALYKNEKFIYFRAYMSRLKEHQIQMHIAGKRTIDHNMRMYSGSTESDAALYLGGVGAYVAAESAKAAKLASELYNYIIDIPTGKIKVVDIPLMQELLEHRPDLDISYTNEGHPEDAASIIRYFKAAYEK